MCQHGMYSDSEGQLSRLNLVEGKDIHTLDLQVQDGRSHSHTCTHSHTHRHTHTCTHTHTHAHTHTQMNVHTHMYAHTHTHMHTTRTYTCTSHATTKYSTPIKCTVCLSQHTHEWQFCRDYPIHRCRPNDHSPFPPSPHLPIPLLTRSSKAVMFSSKKSVPTLSSSTTQLIWRVWMP